MAATAAQAEDSIVVSRRDCAAILRHVPAADVEYKAGKDVYGRPVAPADLGGRTPITVPEEITINLGFYFGERLGSIAGGRYEAKGYIGKITVKDDRVYFNDQLLLERERHAIVEACRKIYGGK